MTRDPYASLKQGLVGCWIPSVSGSGLLLPDLSGRGNNGSLVGMDASDWVSGQYGRALDFDGVDDKVTATHPLGVGVSRCTFSVWMRKTSASDIAISSIGSETADSRFHISWFSDGQLYCTVENGASSYGEVTPSFTSNFRNYCLVYDGTQATNASRLRVFLDGQQVSLSYTGTIPSTAISSNVVAIGAGSGSFSKSQQDDIRIYNRALTEPEIRLLASEPGIGFKRNSSAFSTRYTYQPPKAKVFEGVRVRDHDYSSLRNGLVGAWCPSLANGGSGNTLPDVSGYNNHGVLTGMSQDRWASRSNGRGLEFALSTTEKVAITNDSPVISGFASGDFYASCHFVKSTTNGGALIAKYRDTSPINGWSLSLNSTSVFAEVINPTAFYNSITVSRNLCDGALHHVLMQRQGALVTLWIDGVQAGSLNYSANSLANATPELWIGNYSNGLNIPLGGVIYDARIGNRALSDSEIKLLASRPGIGLRQESHRNTFYQFPSGARRKRILTGMP